jgi:alkylation response protein AidB-like acyl-CoA dehydrogenase
VRATETAERKFTTTFRYGPDGNSRKQLKESAVFELDVSDDRIAVAALARGLAVDILDPAAREAERSHAVPSAVGRALHSTGLLAMVDEAYGGGGVPDICTHMAAVEAFAYGDPGLTMAGFWASAASIVIGRCGTADQQQQWLPALASDPEAKGSVALYEGFGRSPSEFTTTISRAADGRWHIEGRKLAVAFAEAATPLVVVGVDPTDGSLRAAIVDPAAARMLPDPPGLALGATPTSTVDFSLFVDESQLVGGIDPDRRELEIAVGWVRLAVAAALCGTAQRATDYASKYATERVAFGKPIATFQGVSFMLADSALRIGAARLEMFDAAAHLDARLPGSEAVVTRAVNYAGAVGTVATRDAIQVLGGHGFITDHPVELWYRSAAALSVLDMDPLLSNFEPSL